MILFVIVSNVIIGFTQEYKSEQTMASLRKLSSPMAKVIRNGSLREIQTNQVVPGDILIIEQGDVVSADIRLFEAVNLRIDEALLTGESEPVEKV